MRDTVHTPPHHWLRPYHAAASVLAVFVTGAIGSAVTLPVIPTWYRSIAKPTWTPPDAVFGPAWTTLYLLMAGALYRVLGLPRDTPGRTLAIGIFALHMLLNVGWSATFFGMKSPTLGLVDLAIFWPVTILNAWAFWRLDRVAGALMVPNVFWVTFAAALNIAIWRMN